MTHLKHADAAIRAASQDPQATNAIRWVAPAEARRIYGISRRKFEDLVRIGKLQIRKFGPRCRRVAIPASDLEGVLP